MARIQTAPQAETDLLEVWLFIAQDNPRRAEGFLDKILTNCQTLSENPHMGPAREELDPGLRCFPLEGYVIFYRVMEGELN